MNQQGKCSAGLKNYVRKKISPKMSKNGSILKSRPNDAVEHDAKRNHAEYVNNLSSNKAAKPYLSS